MEKDVFRMPTPVTITGRSSSITNSFVNGIVPCIPPTEDEINKALDILGMDRNRMRCAYCGGVYTEWDHLNPLVKKGEPTGYISEIHNLVPACTTCNSSKGNKYWKDWLEGDSNQAKFAQSQQGYEDRKTKLMKYENAFKPITVDFTKVPGWDKYIRMREEIFAKMREAHEASKSIKEELKDWEKYQNNASNSIQETK